MGLFLFPQNKWDVDRNGLISKTDFRKAVPVWSGNLMTHAQMELLFNQLDDDGSEAIDFKELDRKIKGRSYSIDPARSTSREHPPN